MYMSHGPDRFWVKDAGERDKLFPKYQPVSEANNMKGCDLLLDCANLIRLMLAVRADLVSPGMVGIAFITGVPPDGETHDWLTTVSGEIGNKGFREALAIRLLVRDGPSVTRKGSRGEPLAIGSLTRPVEASLYQCVVMSLIL